MGAQSTVAVAHGEARRGEARRGAGGGGGGDREDVGQRQVETS